MSVEKEARQDAREYARAEMFYGEGAGTRRKLIAATVDGKSRRSPEYAREFDRELERQDMADHASKAHREREIKDKTHTINKNVRGLATGNYQSVSTGVMVVAAIGYFAHKTGLDAKIYARTRELIYDIKARRRIKKARKSGTNVYNVTSL